MLNIWVYFVINVENVWKKGQTSCANYYNLMHVEITKCNNTGNYCVVFTYY